MCYCPTPTLHLNLALTGDGAFIFSLKKTHSVWFISFLNYGDTENVLINHLLLVIPMSYPCHYTNLCPHKPHKHAHTHTHTHTHTYTHTHTHTHTQQNKTSAQECTCTRMYVYMHKHTHIIFGMLKYFLTWIGWKIQTDIRGRSWTISRHQNITETGLGRYHLATIGH